MNEFEATIRKNCLMDGIGVDGADVFISQKQNETSSFYEKQEPQKRIKEIIRLVITKVYNALNENYRIPNPVKVSATEWEREWFRARHPKLRAREEQALNQWEKLEKGFEVSARMLENVSVGENRGAGGLAIVEEIERYFNQTLHFRKKMILQKFITERVLCIANNDPESRKLRKELDGRGKQEMESQILKNLEHWDQMLRGIVDKRIEQYKEKQEVLFFNSLKEAQLYKENPDSIQPLDWWY